MNNETSLCGFITLTALEYNGQKKKGNNENPFFAFPISKYEQKMKLGKLSVL